MDFKLGFGPMSENCVDALKSYTESKQIPLMVIASRNQVDYNSGYVMTTRDLYKKTIDSPYLKLCRDHCGPFFNDNEKSLTLTQAINNTKKTIEEDLRNGFKMIHIDTSRCENPFEIAEELIDFTLRLSPVCEFEFGTEENIGQDTTVEKYTEFVNFAKNFPSIKFVVAQTGSLVMEDRQVGSTSVDVLSRLVDVADNNGIKLKEHNADYLNHYEISMRRIAGVHALNIAPQLGVTETKLVLSLANEYGIDTSQFRKKVLDSGKWAKWVLDGNEDKKIEIAGHYLFNSNVYVQLLDAFQNHIDVRSEIHKEIHKVLDHYYRWYIWETVSLDSIS